MQLVPLLNIQADHRTWVGMQFGQYLQLSGKNFWEEILELENDPLFLKLHHQEGIIKLIPRKKPVLSFKREIPVSAFQNFPEVEELLQGKERWLEVFRSLGRDDFGTLFLTPEAKFSRAEISQLTGLTPIEVELFEREVLDKIFVLDNFTVPRYPVFEPYEIIGKIVFVNSKPQLQMFYEKERYQFEETRVKERLEAEFAPDEDFDEVYRILNKLKLVNLRMNLLGLVMDKVFNHQQDFIQTGRPENLKVFEEKELAGELGIDPSWLCRVIQKKIVLTPWGDLELKEFFLTRKKGFKRDGVKAMKELLAKLPKATDQAIAELLQTELGIKIGRRTVNDWRREFSN